MLGERNVLLMILFATLSTMGMVLFITLSIKEVVCTKKNAVFFPDDNGMPVEVPMLCSHTPETVPVNLRAHVRFYLFRRLDDKEERITQMEIGKLLPEIFISNGETKILIHGFLNTIKSHMIQNIKEAFLNTSDSTQLNVIGVDWGDLAKLSTCYVGAVRNTEIVGRYIGKFIDYLLIIGGLNLKNLHLIGHSLGAHTAGIAGEAVTFGKVARITGLDPAGVLYGPWSVKLDKSNAKFVDVIHTDTNELGYKPPCGHVDFYPHGGGQQAGCATSVCSHSRAHVYFRQSIYSELRFPGYACKSLDNVTHCTANGCSGCQAMPSNFMGVAANAKFYGLFYVNASPSVRVGTLLQVLAVTTAIP